MKAQMEQQIQALEEQINLEKFARIASNRPQQLVKTLRYKDYSTFAYLFSMPLYGRWNG